MSLTLVAWMIAYAVLALRAFTHSAIYGLSLYLFTFFINPLFWWWGNDEIGALRWNLGAAIIYAAAVIVERSRSTSPPQPVGKTPQLLAAVFLVNVTAVHVLLAPDMSVSFDRYFLVVKYVALFFVIAASVHDRQALRIAFWSMALGAGYIGYEATINDRGRFTGGRLEGIGAAGVQNSNELAAVMGTILPFVAGIFFTGTKGEKIAIALLGPMILNVVLLCNSRGTFLALIAGALAFLIVTRGPARKTVFKGFALGAIALVALLQDPEIIDRFMTVFASEEERDASANQRLVIWSAALNVLMEHPLGTGGDGFNRFYSHAYLETGRSVHNGFLSEAVEWGVQGILLKLFILGTGAWLVFRTSRRAPYSSESSIIAGCLITSMVVLLGASAFGDYLDDEWTYWIVGLMLGYARAYGSPVQAGKV